MEFECENCNLTKDIPSKHYAKFSEKYVVFGRVTCPKCEGLTNLTKSQAELLKVSAPYNPSPDLNSKVASEVANETAMPRQGAADDAKTSARSEVLRFSATLKTVSSVLFVLIMLVGSAGGAIVGIQSEPIGPAVGGTVGAALALLPALITSATFRFCRHTLQLLVQIAEK